MIPVAFYWAEDDGTASIRDLFAMDLHLSDRVWVDTPMEGDAKFALEQIVALTKRRLVSRLHFGGDVIDKSLNRSSPISTLAGAMEELDAADVLVPYVQGQHEYDSPPWLSQFSNAYHYDTKGPIYLDGLRIGGMDYRSGDAIAKRANELVVDQGCQLLVMHQVWHELMQQRTAKSQLSIADTDSRATVISGDLHRWEVFAQDDRVRLLSPGATHLRTINEPREHYVVGLEMKQEQGQTIGVFRRIKLFSRVVTETYVSSNAGIDTLPGTLEALVAQSQTAVAAAAARGLTVPETIQRPLLIVRLGQGKIDKHKIERLCAPYAHLQFGPGHKAAAPAQPFAGLTPVADSAGFVHRGADMAYDALAAEVSPSTQPTAYQLGRLLLDAPEGTDYDRLLSDWSTHRLDRARSAS